MPLTEDEIKALREVDLHEMRQTCEPMRDEPYTQGCSHCQMHRRKFLEVVTPERVLSLLDEIERLRREIKDAAAEARWQERQGEDYGSF